MTKGQVSLFIVLGATIVIVVGLLIYLQTTTEPSVQDLPIVERGAEQIIKSCLEASVAEALFTFGAQGGYATTPPATIAVENATFTVGVLGTEVLLPTQEDMFIEAAIAAGEVAEQCLEQPSLEGRGWTISAGDVIVRVTPQGDETLVRLDWPVNIQTRSGTATVSEWLLSVKINLHDTHAHALQVASLLVEDRVVLPLTAAQIDETRPVAMTAVNATTMLVSVQDLGSTRNDNPFAFVFAADREDIRAPVLVVPSSFTLQDSVPFTYTVIADTPVTFEDDSALFDIGISTGVISFTPEIPDLYEVFITATNKHGLSTSVPVIFEVLP